MKQLYLILSLLILCSVQGQFIQTDSIYYWKSGVVLGKRSIKTADLDSITFKNTAIPSIVHNKIYVYGNFGATSTYSNFDPSNSPVLFSKLSNDNYEGYVWMNYPAPLFLLTYDINSGYIKGDATNPNGYTNLALGGFNFIKPLNGPGTYYINVDWSNDLYSIGIRQISIIGAATPNGWGSPTYLNFNTDPTSPFYRMYTIDLALTADEFAIRMKDDWSEKMGSVSGNTETEVLTSPNPLKIGGGNLKVPTAGNYKVVLDISNSTNYNLRLIPLP